VKLPIIAAAVLCSVSMLVAQEQRPATRLRSIALDRGQDGSVLVVIQADGALTPSESGVLADPPRIFFDFPELLPAAKGIRGLDNTTVRQVRVALHSAAPRVTRVVIDLAQAAAYRLETSGNPSKFVVAISAAPHATTESVETVGPTPPVPVATPNDPPAVGALDTPPVPRPVPNPSPNVPPPGVPRGSDSARDQLVGIVDRFEKLRLLLMAIDGRSSPQAVDLQLASEELAAIAKAATAVKYSPRTNVTQGRLLQACALASQAVKARIESEATGNTALGWTAASAAAGTLLMLDTARAELGLAPVTP
jgi:hypothetical protein